MKPIKLAIKNFLSSSDLSKDEFISILELAELIKNKINPKLKFCFKDLPQDDPIQRRPLISVAEKHCNWHPKIKLDEGLDYTIKSIREVLNL